jgi:hypothetical protein
MGIPTPGNQQVSVAFSPPINLGTGTPTYIVTTSSLLGGPVPDVSGLSSPIVVTGLTNGVEYFFTVTATNSFGSTNSGVLVVATPAGVPATPSAPTASLPSTYGNTTASLSWTAPDSNGSPITDYFVQFSSNGGASWTTFTDGISTLTSTTITGLTNGTAYVFRVAAVNLVGNSTYSPASNSVTPLAGKIPTPVIGDIAETTNSIPWCYPQYDTYTQVKEGGLYYYVYFDFNVDAPNDDNGSCHGWTGLGENVYRYTKLKLTRPGWADSDAIEIAETTNVYVAPVVPPVVPVVPPVAPPPASCSSACNAGDCGGDPRGGCVDFGYGCVCLFIDFGF